MSKQFLLFTIFMLLIRFTSAEYSADIIHYDFISFTPPITDIHYTPNVAVKSSLFEIDFTRGKEACFSHPSLSLFGDPREFSIHLWSSSSGCEIEVLFGSHFQFFRKTVGILTVGEQTIHFPAPPEGWIFSGGENDGKVRLPLRFLQLVIKKANCPSDVVQIQILNFLCKTQLLPTQTCILVPSIHKTNSGSLISSCSIINLLSEPCDGALSIHAKDWEEQILTQYKQQITLPPVYHPIQMQIPIEIPSYKNFIEVIWTYHRSDGKEFTATSSFTRDIDNPVDTTLKEDSPWGMGLYFYRYGSNQPARKQCAELASRAGIKWTREDFSWSAIEPTRGKFDFSYYDNIVNTGIAYGISTYALLCYWSPWTEPYTLQGIDDFVRYAEATVTHFKDRIKYWEIYNEPNIFFWQGPKELYPELVKRCYKAIKQIDPNAQVLAISTSGIDREFIKFCLSADTPFDILTIHPYRSKLNEKMFIRELQDTAKLIGHKPIWITEMGWSTHLWNMQGVTERNQALLLAKSYLSAIASGVVSNISWYDFRNDGDDIFYFEHNFGIVRSDFSLKPSYRACTTVCKLLPSARIETLDTGNDNIIAFQQENKIVLWSTQGNIPIRFKPKTTPVQFINLMGETIFSTDKKESFTLVLKEGYPVFLNQGTVKLVTKPKPTPRNSKTNP